MDALDVMNGLGIVLFGVFVVIQTYFLVRPVTLEQRHKVDRMVGVAGVVLAGAMLVALGVLVVLQPTVLFG